MLYFSVTTISLHVYLLSVSYSNFFYKLINVHFDRPVTRGGARGAFAPSPQAPKVRILILNIQVKECSQLN